MLQYSNLNRVMEAETISTNAASLKSQMSRVNLIKKMFLFCVMLCFSAGAWGQSFIITGKLKSGKPITISIDIAEKKLFVLMESGYDFSIKIERMRVIDIGEQGSGRKRVDLYLEDWKTGEDKGDMRYFMIAPEIVYWSDNDMIIGALEIPIENLKEFSISALVNAVNASKNGTTINPPTVSVGQQVQITNSGKTYTSINEGNCLTWPNDEIKLKAGSWEWGEYNFDPQIGMKGKVVHITKHCDNGKVIYILLINNKFYVPIQAAGVRLL